MKRRTVKIFLSLVVLALMPGSGLAGGLKGKIQQKLNAPSNVQYEPYYLERSSAAGAPQTVSPSEGFQSSAYSTEFGLVEGLSDQPQRERKAIRAPQPEKIPPVLSPSAIYNVYYTDK